MVLKQYNKSNFTKQAVDRSETDSINSLAIFGFEQIRSFALIPLSNKIINAFSLELLCQFNFKHFFTSSL